MRVQRSLSALVCHCRSRFSSRSVVSGRLSSTIFNVFTSPSSSLEHDLDHSPARLTNGLYRLDRRVGDAKESGPVEIDARSAALPGL